MVPPPKLSRTRELRLGPLPVLKTFGQRAVLRCGGIQKERVIVPWTGRRDRAMGVSGSDAPAFDGLTSLIFFGFQIVWNKSTRRAAERGGARVGRPRWVSILTITGGSSMAATIFNAPPQFRQFSMSMSKTW